MAYLDDVDTLLHQGQQAECRRDFIEALAWYRRCLSVARNLRDTEGESFALHHIGIVHQEMGRLAEAKEFFGAAIALERRGDDPITLSGSLYQLGRCHAAAGEFTEAEKIYREALTMQQRSDFQLGQARTYFAMADLATDRHEFDRAKACIVNAEQLDCARDNVQLQETAESLRLKVGYLEGDFASAARSWLLLLKLTASMPDHLSLSRSLHLNLFGLIFLNDTPGRFATYLDTLLEVLPIASEYGPSSDAGLEEKRRLEIVFGLLRPLVEWARRWENEGRPQPSNWSVELQAGSHALHMISRRLIDLFRFISSTQEPM